MPFGDVWMERTQMVAVRTDLFCDFMVELRLLQQRNFFDAGVLSLPQQSGSRGHVLSAVYSSASAFRPPRWFSESHLGWSYIWLDFCNGLCRFVYLPLYPYKPEGSTLVILCLLSDSFANYWPSSAGSQGIMLSFVNSCLSCSFRPYFLNPLN